MSSKRLWKTSKPKVIKIWYRTVERLLKGALLSSFYGEKAMFRLMEPSKGELSACAGVYLSAYGGEPWKEVYEKGKIEAYLAGFCGQDGRKCLAAEENGEIMGVALILVVPSIDAPYFRIEDFCVSAEKQRMGYGTLFMKGILEEAKKEGCDSVLLGTQRGFPSHRFYLKNGFTEIDSVLLYRPI